MVTVDPHQIMMLQKHAMSQVTELVAYPATDDLVRHALGKPVTYYGSEPVGPILRGWRSFVDGVTSQGRVREAFEAADRGAELLRNVPEHPLSGAYLHALDGLKADEALIRSRPGAVPASLERFRAVIGDMVEFHQPQYP